MSVRDDHGIRVLASVYVMHYICKIVWLNHSCIPGTKPIWSQCMTFLMIYCILFASILLRISASMFIRDWLVILCFSRVLVVRKEFTFRSKGKKKKKEKKRNWTLEGAKTRVLI